MKPCSYLVIFLFPLFVSGALLETRGLGRTDTSNPLPDITKDRNRSISTLPKTFSFTSLQKRQLTCSDPTDTLCGDFCCPGGTKCVNTPTFLSTVSQAELTYGQCPLDCCPYGDSGNCCDDAAGGCCQLTDKCVNNLEKCCPKTAETCGGDGCYEAGAVCCSGGTACASGQTCCGTKCCSDGNFCCADEVGCCATGEICCPGTCTSHFIS